MSFMLSNDDEFQNISEDSEFDEKVRKLEEEVSEKNREIDDLTKQVSQVSQLTDKLEKAQNEINKLNSEKSDLRREIEDLTNRLQLSCETNEQLQNQLNTEKANHRNVRHEEYENVTSKFADKQKQLQEEIARLENELKNSQSQVEQKIIDSKTNASKIERVLKSSSRFFGQEIESLNDLQHMFDTNSFKQAPLPPQPVSPKVDNSDSMVKKYKQQRNEARKRIEELENAYQSLESSKDAEMVENKRKYQNLEKQLKQALDEKDRISDLRLSEVRGLQQKLANLKAEFKQKQLALLTPTPTKPGVITTPLEHKSNEKHANTEIRNASEISGLCELDDVQSQIISTQKKHAKEISNLQKEFREKLNQQPAAKTPSQEQQEKNQKLESDYENLVLENETLKKNIEILKNDYKELESTNESLRNAINMLQTEEKPAPPPPKRDYKSECKRYAKQVEELENRLAYIQKLNSQNEETINSQKSALEYEKLRAVEAEENIRQLTFDVHEMKNKLENQPKVTPDDLLPPEAWHSVHWPAELANEIDKIISKSALQAQSKLQCSLDVIKNYYESCLNEKGCELESCEKFSNNLKYKINKFIIDISIAITDQSSTIEDLLNDNTDEIVNSANSLRKKYDELQIYYNKLDRVTDHLKEVFNLQTVEDNDDLIAQIDEIFNHIQLQNTHVVDCHKKIKKLKAENEETQNVTKKQVLELTKKNTDLMNQLEDAKATIEDHEKEIQIAKEHVEVLQSQLNEDSPPIIHNKSNDSLNFTELRSPHGLDTRELELIHGQLEQKENQLQQQALTANKRILELNNALEASSSKVENLETIIANLEEQNKQLENQVAEITEQSRKRTKQDQERFEKAKRDAEEAYNMSIQNLQKSSETTRADLEKMAKELAKVTSEYRNLKQTHSKLIKKQKKDHDEFKRLKSSIEREKLVMDAQARTKIIDAQGELNEKLIQEKNRYETEKKRIINIFADQFKEFFSPLRAIDEREFRVGVEKARETYKKLLESDTSIREMLQAKNKQTTEDAVAQMFFANKEE